MNYGLAKMAKEKIDSAQKHKQKKQETVVGMMGGLAAAGAASSPGNKGGIGSAKAAIGGAITGGLASIPMTAYMDHKRNKLKEENSLTKKANMNDESPQEREERKNRKGMILGGIGGGLLGSSIGGQLGAQSGHNQGVTNMRREQRDGTNDIHRYYDRQVEHSKRDWETERESKRSEMSHRNGLMQMDVDSAAGYQRELDTAQNRPKNEIIREHLDRPGTQRMMDMTETRDLLHSRGDLTYVNMGQAQLEDQYRNDAMKFHGSDIERRSGYLNAQQQELEKSKGAFNEALDAYRAHGKENPNLAGLATNRDKQLAELMDPSRYANQIDDLRRGGQSRGRLIGGAAGALGLGALGGMMGRNKENQPE